MNPKNYAPDNSAILYLALMRKRHTNIYRFSVTMDEPVDPAILQKAADRVYRRFPTIIAGFRPGFFRYTQVPAEQPPQVRPDPGVLIPMTKREIARCAYRVYYRDYELIYEGFHAAADGYGAMASFTTLIAEYLRLRYRLTIGVSGPLRDPGEEPPESDLTDEYLRHCGGRPLHLPSRYSYQLPGDYREPDVYPTTRFYDTADLLAAARKEGVSLTTLLNGIMARSIMEVQLRHERKLKPVRIMVPADLRRMFPSTTMRNFILYALPTMEPGEEKLPLGELLRSFQTQTRDQLAPGRLASIMAYNVRAQASLPYRLLPLQLKRFAMRVGYRFFGESNSSITLTNLGSYRLPPEMESHVKDLRVILTPRAGSPYNCGVIGLGGRLAITLSRFCPQSELEEVFFPMLDRVLSLP